MCSQQACCNNVVILSCNNDVILSSCYKVVMHSQLVKLLLEQLVTTCNKSVEFNNLEQLVSKLGSSGNIFYIWQLVRTALAQNKDTQKVDSAKKSVTDTTPWFTMIRHQNADAMVLASALMRHIHPPLNVHHFKYYQGGEYQVTSQYTSQYISQYTSLLQVFWMCSSGKDDYSRSESLKIQKYFHFSIDGHES